MKISKNTIILLTIGAFFGFLVFGFSDNLKGPVLPAILQNLHLSYSMGGTILLGAYLGFIVATISAGLLADAAGQKTVLVLAGICLAAGVAGYSSFSSPVLLTLSMMVLGFGMGCLELGCNALIVELHAADKGRYLNLMAVFHGLGSTIAPLYAGWLLAANVSWRTVYRWDFLPISIMIVLFIILRFPQTQKSQNVNLKHIGKAAFTVQMIWFYALITFYVCIELGLASWMVEFLQKNRAFSILQSNQALAWFFGLIMVGRFVGSFFIEKLGYLRAIFIASLLASACTGIGLFGPTQFTFLLPGTGFFLSVIFPTITASVSDSHKENMNSMLGILFTFAGIGGLIGPWVVGIASDLGGLQFGFGLNVIFGMLTSFAAFVLIRLQGKKV